MEVDIRHLRVVLTVAESGSVSSAATQLGVSQPALSAQLGRIEHAFGGSLFARGREGVRPTPLGEFVIDRARELAEQLDFMIVEARRQTSETGPLRVGCNTSRYFSAFMLELEKLGFARTVMPFVDTSSGVITEHLLRREVDVAFAGVHVGYDDACPPGLRQSVVVAREPFFVAIAASHPLATQREIPLSALGEDEWLLPPGKPDGTYAALQDAFRQAGISPASPLGRQSLPDFWPYIAARRAVALAMPSDVPAEGVVLRPLQGQPVAGTRIVRWNPSRVSEAEAEVCVRAAQSTFLQELEETAMNQPWWDEFPSHRPTLRPPLPPVGESVGA
ncbi:LysR family transcriptional regulator [Intrasporangium sp.]|uniref:LysR family transcriptional regulator n=1 Tax=Intrasporangium sp. TaxID=1925024 RepID=UPI00293ABBBC|nr:LysR family transcriptional regulator [Intrasporangium sp.]MDV3220502.1 LysR family transcriptional regulator [Intrasporangium sp.]